MVAEQSIKVLMYHGIVNGTCALPDDRETGAELYDLPSKQFEHHMSLLKDKGYKIINVSTDPHTANTIAITFDDGELNNFEVALPILKKFGYIAYFFIIVGRVGRKGYMSWEQIKKLHDEGMIIGSHGLSHQILTSLMESQIDEELRASKRTIEVNLNIPIDTLSIPRGFCNDALIQKAYELGYKTIFISDRPDDLKSHCLSRIAVKDNWTVKHLGHALSGKKTLRGTFFLKLKKGIKNLLKEDAYNKVRSILIKIFK
jgi:peptidoglycan/xylan/chitin deacetylase (PgdA/CDA1 family)